MSKKEEKEQQPKTTILLSKEEGPSSRTDRALEYQFSRTSIRERLKAAKAFREECDKVLGDRFVKRPEIKSLIEQLYTDLSSSYGAGIAESEPLTLRNLNAGEWFFLEFARSRRDCTIYNVTSRKIKAWNYDYNPASDTDPYKQFSPGEIMRYGDDNPWTIEIGMICIRLLHHNPFRSIPALEGRPQITLFKEEMIEKKPSWDTVDPNKQPAPRTPEK